MAKRHVLILGAGFGGLELATRLSEAHGDAVRVTLLDRNDSFYFGFSKLEVMLGRQTPDDVRLYYRDVAKDGVEFRQETVTGIDPTSRRVTTDAGSYDPDFLVVALGADYDMAATPGLAEGGSEYYTLAGAQRLCETLPMQRPVPVTEAVSQLFRDQLAERGIEERPQQVVTSIDPARKEALLASGETLPYDLFVGIPKHRVPDPLPASGLAVDGWVPVDGGSGVCYAEFGGGLVSKVEVNFLGGDKPAAEPFGATLAYAAEKEEFGATRRARWFGH